MSRFVLVGCNGAILPGNLKEQAKDIMELEYREELNPGIQISLPKLVHYLNYIPDRVKDLLELTGYLFCADRSIRRGTKNSLENRGWARDFHFVIKVRDPDFWNDSTIKEKLNELLTFMTGDRKYDFTFQGGQTTSSSFFDKEDFAVKFNRNTKIILFSGGLDSMAGVIETLQEPNTEFCLVSHQSKQPASVLTQRKLVEWLKTNYPNRVINHYRFFCHLRSKTARAQEETQRTRSLLYSSIAFALADRLPSTPKGFTFFENGITSINFRRHQDAINARTSRTTHPKTIVLLEELFSKIGDYPVRIETPFRWKTKAEVYHLLANRKSEAVISSTVSCSRTFQTEGKATHCGGCFQCIDRRFAAYTAGLEAFDESGLYCRDFIRGNIGTFESGDEIKKTLLGYVRQAINFSRCSVEKFYAENNDELLEIYESNPESMEEVEFVNKVYELCKRHGIQVEAAMKRIREVNDELFKDVPKGSFLEIINNRDYLREDVVLAAMALSVRFKSSIPLAFQSSRPANERELNDHIQALLSRDEFEREFPVVSFATSQAKPDHSKDNLWIEVKYLRGDTTPSKITEAIAADLIKYAQWSHILFVIYDPDNAIKNRAKFKKDFESRGKCTICIVH